MDVNAMLANSHAHDAGRAAAQHETERNGTPAHASPTKPNPSSASSRTLRSGESAAATTYSSPAKKDKKHVVFQLIDTQDPRIQARLPMRVMISAHDTAESIITTVKNFYGLYEYGVSFEDKQGIGMVAAYDNFEHDMVVYVRTVALPRITSSDHHQRDSASPKRPTLGAPIDLRHSLAPSHGLSPSRSAAARSIGARSTSPTSDAGRRSISAAPGGRGWPQRAKSKDNVDADGYSSGDNAEGSVASSRRSKAELVNAEISIDNIVEGGRRKRAFESSELPLFVPPQVPMTTSISSVSPQRRVGPPHASPYAYPQQQTFSYQHALPSPQSYGGTSGQLHSGGVGNGVNTAQSAPSRQLRARSGQIFYPPRHSNGGVLPTPDPTVGSAISDEDVALQLMRLGDPTAFSHGRHSTSTADDAFSGKADAASSDEEEVSEDDDAALASMSRVSTNNTGPLRKKQRLTNDLPSDVTSGDEYEDRRDATFNDSSAADLKKKPSKSGKSRPSSTTAKAGRPRTNSMSKPKSKPASISTAHPANSVAHPKGLVSPASMPAPSRKGSIASASALGPAAANGSLTFHHALGQDEEDLSSKPRCQRCRKSKKGCDRQRPCGRCRDAGIGIEGCVSEDEGNGRKGRYGRHMGVPIKRSDDSLASGYSKMEYEMAHGDAGSENGLGDGHGHGHGHVAAAAATAEYVGNGHAATHSATLAAASGYANGAYAATASPAVAGGNNTAPFLAPALPDKNKKRKR